MEIDLSDYSIETLIELKDKISGIIYNHNDGYLYICNVRSYGRNWNDNGISNLYTLQELCNQYNGDDCIVDIYSNNPNLSSIHNYGDLMFIKSKEDYDKWKKYEYLINTISTVEKELENWDNRDNISFKSRPMFKPFDTQEDLINYKKELAEYDMSFIPPQNSRSQEN